MDKPLIIKRHGRTLAVLAFTDLDGTVNDQRALEKDRLATIAPAKDAICTLQSRNIPVGVVTARSFGETMLYQHALNTNGFTITEDGAVVVLPNDMPQTTPHIVTHDNQKALILSTKDVSKIKAFLKHITQELNNKGLPSDIISSCTTPAEELKEIIHCETREDAIRATDRLASAFVREITEEQLGLITQEAGSWNLRITGKPHHAHLIGKDADKGSALQFINENIRLFLPNEKIDGILPIVFGNDYNDLRLFEEAHKLDGIGVIVNDTKGSCRVSSEDIPSYVMQTKQAHGFGIQESLEAIFKRLVI